MPHHCYREVVGPLLAGVDLDHRKDEWVGFRPCTRRRAAAGRRQRRPVLVAGGHGMWGTALGPLTGKLLAQRIATGLTQRWPQALETTENGRQEVPGSLGAAASQRGRLSASLGLSSRPRLSHPGRPAKLFQGSDKRYDPHNGVSAGHRLAERARTRSACGVGLGNALPAPPIPDRSGVVSTYPVGSARQ